MGVTNYLLTGMILQVGEQELQQKKCPQKAGATWVRQRITDSSPCQQGDPYDKGSQK